MNFVKTPTMKTKIEKELWEIMDNDEAIRIEHIMDILDRFGLYAIKLIGKDEKEMEKNLFGDQTIVQERVIRNIFRKELREKLRKELFK